MQVGRKVGVGRAVCVHLCACMLMCTYMCVCVHTCACVRWGVIRKEREGGDQEKGTASMSKEFLTKRKQTLQ